MHKNNFIPSNSRLKNKTTGFSFFYYIWLFSFLSILGWLWEVSLYLITSQTFVNRGILTGPWLPIYGAGGLFLYVLLYRIKKHPLGVFFLSTVICSILEYFCSWFMEQMWQIRWWDYSHFRFNLNGRISLITSISFGIAALLLVYLLVPGFEKLYEKIPSGIRKTVGIILLFLFIADATYAAMTPNIGKGITY